MTLTLLKSLVETPSKSSDEKGLKAVQKLLEKAFDPLGAKKELKGSTLFYRMRPKAKIQILLGGHYDTVHEKKVLLTREGAKLKGPGVADMKGGLVVLLKALKAFEKTAHRDTIGWRLFLNHDEEIGSPLSGPELIAFAKGAQAAFLFEPSLPDGSLISNRKGSMNILIRSQGKGAHAGRDLEKGINALTPLAHLIVALGKTKGLNIAALNGGSAFNIVPQEGELKINFRWESEREKKAFETKFKALLKKYHLSEEIISFRPLKPLDKGTRNLLKLLNYPVKAQASGGVTDGNLFSALGIPTIDTLGVVGGALHTDAEYMEEKSLEERSALFLNFLKRLSEGKISLC